MTNAKHIPRLVNTRDNRSRKMGEGRVGEELLILTFMPLSRERKGEKGRESAGGAVSKVKDEEKKSIFFLGKERMNRTRGLCLCLLLIDKEKRFPLPRWWRQKKSISAQCETGKIGKGNPFFFWAFSRFAVIRLKA